MNFIDLFILAKRGESFAVKKIMGMYQPLLMKEAIIEGTYDEDLYQEFCLTLLRCINKFKV